MELRENWMGWLVHTYPEVAFLPGKTGIREGKAVETEEDDDVVEVTTFTEDGAVLEDLPDLGQRPPVRLGSDSPPSPNRSATPRTLARSTWDGPTPSPLIIIARSR